MTTLESRSEPQPEAVVSQPTPRKRKPGATAQQKTAQSPTQATTPKSHLKPVEQELESDSIKIAANTKRIVDAVLFATNRALTVEEIRQVYPELEQPEIKKIQAAIESITVLSPQQTIKHESNPEPAEQAPENHFIAFDVNTKRIVEAIMFAANRTMTIKQIQQVFPELEQPEIKDIQAAVDSIIEDYSARPVGLKKLASGYRFQVKEGMSPWISRLFEEKPPRYSRALLETLAIIAYRQPATRGEIEDIRGVSVSSNIIRTLLDREWIRVIAHKEVPGRPALYGTTKQMLDYFNLSSLDELPTLEEIKDLDLSGTPDLIEQAEQNNSEKQETDTQEERPESESIASADAETVSPKNRTIH